MTLGDSTIKHNINVSQSQTSQSGVDSSRAVTTGSKFVVPVTIDEELLKLVGLTPEEYLQLTDKQKAEVNDQLNQIKNSSDTTNFGIKGLYVESNSNIVDGKLPSIENPIETKEEIKEQNELIKSEITKNREITESDWKKMSSEERRAYIKTMLDDVLKDVPEEKRGELIREFVDKRLKENRGFSDERWEKMSADRKERLRDRFFSDFSLAVENGFTKEEFEALSYEDKLHLEIKLRERQINTLTEDLENLPINYEAGSKESPEELHQRNTELIAKLKSKQEKTIQSDNLLEAIKSMGANRNDNNPRAGESQLSDLVQLKKDSSDFNSKNADSVSLPRASHLDRGQRRAAFMEEFKTLYGHNVDFNNVEDRNKFNKMMTDKSKVLPVEKQAQAKFNYFTDTILELSSQTQSTDINVKKRAEEQLNTLLETASEYGITKEVIQQMANGQFPQDGIENLNETLGNLATVINKIKAPNPRQKTFVKDISTIQSHVIANGVKPSEAFDNLYINEQYSDVVGEGIRENEGSKAVIGYLTSMTPRLHKDKQLSEYNKNMAYTYTLKRDADIIDSQKQLYDTIGDLAVENQSHAFETTMASKFDEVQEYAANNIYKLDESVRDWAADYTRSLGKENLNNAIRMEAPPATDSHKSGASNANSDFGYNESVNNSTNFVTNTISNNANISNEISKNIENLSSNTKNVYNEINLKEGNLSRDEAIKYFKSLSRKEQSDLLNALPAQLFNKLPVTICENFPEYVSTFVEKGRGIEIITTCSSVIANSAIKSMKVGSSKTKKELNEFIAQHPEMFNKISQEAAQKALGGSDDNKIEKPLKFKA